MWLDNEITKLFLQSIEDKFDDVESLGLIEIESLDGRNLEKAINLRRGYKMAMSDLMVEPTHTLEAYKYIEEEEEE